MGVKVELSIGEDYPHLFASTNPEDIRYAEENPDSVLHVVIELSDEDWAAYQEAERRYYEWIKKLDTLRKQEGGK